MMADGTQSDQTFIPDAENAKAFRDALGRFATGVAVITTEAPDGPMGFTANSFASVSMDPPLVLWSPARSSLRFPVYNAAQFYSIHILSADQTDWSRRFVRGGAGFDGLPVQRTPEGVPVLTGALARFDCERHTAYDGGDHVIIVGRVLRASTSAGEPLIFAKGRYGTLLSG